MHILFWGTYDTGKPRTRILREGLRRNGVRLSEIHASVWEGTEDKSQVRGVVARLRLLARWLLAYPGLIWRLLRAPKPDLILVGYPGILDVFVASLAGRVRGVPVVWDVFLSIYDTVVEDRGLLRRGDLAARLLHGLERCALRRAALVFMDTRAHARRIETLFALPEGSCESVWVGVETEHFAPPAEPAPRDPAAPLRVLFYGQFIPLHGITTIVEAARRLRDLPVEWTLIGRGQEAPAIRAMLAAEPLPRVRWIEWVDYERLQSCIAEADLCLGIFGTSEKAASVIPNKVFQIVAAGRPLITRDSPAIRELLASAPPCVRLVRAGDADDLAEAVRAHLATPMRHDADHCHAAVRARIDAAAVGRQLLDVMERRLSLR